MAIQPRGKPTGKPRSSSPVARKPATRVAARPAASRAAPGRGASLSARSGTPGRKKPAPQPVVALQLPAAGPARVTLTPAQRSALRARAHSLSPVVQLGQAGLTEAVLLEMERALRAHELIKISIPLTEREARAALLTTLCERLLAAAVQQIGKVLVLYRPK